MSSGTGDDGASAVSAGQGRAPVRSTGGALCNKRSIKLLEHRCPTRARRLVPMTCSHELPWTRRFVSSRQHPPPVTSSTSRSLTQQRDATPETTQACLPGAGTMATPGDSQAIDQPAGVTSVRSLRRSQVDQAALLALAHG
jgi:hypothetical protein